LPLPPKPEVENLKPCPHGGPNWAELRAMGLNPEEVVDFSSNANPFLPPPGVRKIFNTIAINHYPDSETTELRQRLSERLGVTADNILVGNGAVELIRLIALTYFRPEGKVLILEPTFGEYEIACQIVGAEVFKQWADDSFVVSIEETVSLIKQHRPRGVFVCNPNNPTGKYLSRQEVEMILDTCIDSLLILDEAYITFVDQSWSSIDLIPQGNVITHGSLEF